MAPSSYSDALAWLYGLQPRGIRLELDRMRAALALRGDPHAGLRVIHVAGTNGKGSVCAMLEAALRASGLHTGLYTSPHLHTFGERIRVDGVPLEPAEAARRVDAMRRELAREGAPLLTFFEVTTLLALEAFRDAGVDVVVLEVGLGGRLDATNVFEAPLLTLITPVDLDHQAYLGPTLREIAAEKAGILKPGVLCVTSARGEARVVIAERARALGAPLEDVTWSDEGARVVVAREGATLGLTPPLAGDHQRENTALVAAALLALGGSLSLAPADALEHAVAAVRWPGRLERVARSPTVILDAAHNPHGAASLARFASTRAARPRALVFGAMTDKEWRLMLDALAPAFDHVVTCAPEMPRAASPAELAAHAGGEAAASVALAVARAQELVGPEGEVFVAGSIFVIAAARAELLGIASDPPIRM